MLHKILVVAGGTGDEFEGLTSAEVLILGDWQEWQYITDPPVPKVRHICVDIFTGKHVHIRLGQEFLSSAKVGNTIYLSGGESVYRADMQDYEDRHSILVWEPDQDEEDEVVGEWVEVGKMRIARNFHGMAAVPEEFVKKYCDIPD